MVAPPVSFRTFAPVGCCCAFSTRTCERCTPAVLARATRSPSFAAALKAAPATSTCSGARTVLANTVPGAGVAGSVGCGVGAGVGVAVGTGVGDGVGVAVGTSVGDGVGEAVGLGVGEGEGEGVGEGVGRDTQELCPPRPTV